MADKLDIIGNVSLDKFCESPTNYVSVFNNEYDYNNAISVCTFIQGIARDGLIVLDDIGSVLNSLFRMFMSPTTWEFILGLKISEWALPRLSRFFYGVAKELIPVMRDLAAAGFETIAHAIVEVSSAAMAIGIKIFLGPLFITLGATEFVSLVTGFAFKILAEFLEFFSSGPVQTVLFLLMIVDLVNPCGYTNPDVGSAADFQEAQADYWEPNFKDQILFTYPTPSNGLNVFGEFVFENTYPIEVDFSQFMYLTKIDSDSVNKTKYDAIYKKSYFDYLFQIRVNSYGNSVIWPTQNIDPFNENQIALFDQSLSYLLAGENTVVANWLERNLWWIVMILIIVIAVVIILL